MNQLPELPVKHLAIMRNPWYKLVKFGDKRVECRASKNMKAPYNRVHIGHLIYFKEMGNHPVDVFCRVNYVEYYTTVGELRHPNPNIIQEQLIENKDDLYINSKFIEKKREARYLSLLWLSEPTIIEPIAFAQKGQISWFVNYPATPMVIA